MTDVLVYSSISGELPKIVDQETPMCFVKWEDYLKLKEINEKLSERLSWKCECRGCIQT